MSLEVEHRARLRAVAHPLRLRILSLLTSAAMTATEVARELDITQANASYHLRQLLASGYLQIAGEEKIRGGVAKRYRHDFESDLTDLPSDVLRQTSPDDVHGVYAALAVELQRRSLQVRPGAGNLLADAEFWVDPAQWAEIRQRISDAADDLHRVAKPPRTPGAIKVSATVALFRMEEHPA